jgi:hypothetical protein
MPQMELEVATEQFLHASAGFKGFPVELRDKRPALRPDLDRLRSLPADL